MKRSVLLIVFIVLFVGSQAFGLNFQTVTDQLEKTYDVEFAILEVERLEKEIMALLNPEDFNVGLNPTIKAISLEDGDFGQEIALSGTASLKVPLGLSDLEKEKLNFSLNTLRTAEVSVETAREKAFVKLYNLYQNAWLLQEEEPILELEVRAAENYSEILQQRFETGTVSLITLATADETLQERNDNYSQNILKQRLAWYELMFTVGLEMEPEILEKNTLTMEVLPRPPELNSWIEENHPLVSVERVRIEQLKQTIERMKKPNLDISVKPFLNYNDHSASMTYSFTNPELTSAYSFPVYTFGEIPVSSGSSESTWNTGVTVNISLGSNKSDNLNIDAFVLGLRSAEAKLEFLIESLNLQLRSSHQQLIRNQGALDQSRRDLIRSKDNHKIVETRKDLGQASPFDILESESLVARAEWKIESARITTENSWLSVLEAAALFSEVSLNY
ncbi:MAG: TolC family protein [Spirochaetia bacterium]|jgi:outer membrane protein TolC|nr:TolC family protein [Spirochaetia bacterium]